MTKTEKPLVYLLVIMAVTAGHAVGKLDRKPIQIEYPKEIVVSCPAPVQQAVKVTKQPQPQKQPLVVTKEVNGYGSIIRID